MRLALFRMRATSRSRWRHWAGVALLLGVLLGLSLTTLAGARRTQSAYPRFLRGGHASTIALTSGATDDRAVEAQVRRFPEVVDSASYVSYQATVLVHGQPDFDQDFEPVGTLDGRFFSQDRFAATTGRMPNVHAPGEVAVNEYSAERYGYRVGQRLKLGIYSQAQLGDDSFFAHPPPPVRRTSVTVVGIGVFPDEVFQDEGDRTTRVLFTPAFSRQMDGLELYSVQGVVLRRGDRSIRQVTDRYERIVPSGTSTYRLTSTDEYHAQSAVRPLSTALAGFGLIAGAAGLFLVAQAITRMMRTDRSELAALRAVGARPRSIVASLVLAPILMISAGLVIAVTLAIAASPLLPIGPAHRVEADPGIDVDLTVLVGGAAIALFVLALTTIIQARAELPHRLASRQRRPLRSSRVVEWAASSGASAPAIVGLRFTLEPADATTSVAVRSVIPTAVVAVAAVLAAATFGTSLATLVERPALYGWTWDLTAIDALGYGNLQPGKVAAILDHDRRIAGWSGAYFGSATIDGQDVPLLGMAPEAELSPPIIEGRRAARSDEAVLGTGTARQLDKRVGDVVSLGGLGAQHRLTVVGLATLPTIGIVHGSHPSLGIGAVVAPRLVPGFDRDITNTQQGKFGPNAVFIRLKPGVAEEPMRKLLRRRLAAAADFGGIEVVPIQRPAEIVNASAVGAVPALLAGALAAGVMVSLALALAASVRRRSRELNLLRCLGFTRRQLAATVRWQATSTVLLSLLVGLPMGLALGRWSWILFARRLDVVPHPTVAPAIVVGVVLLVVLVANAAAALPAARAARTRAA